VVCGMRTGAPKKLKGTLYAGVPGGLGGWNS
jgi:hypothetical protein